MLLLLLTFPSWACPVPGADVTFEAQRALEATDIDALPALLTDLSCVEDRMPTEGAIALHRLIALERWEQRDVAAAAAHLRATPNDGWEPTDPALRRVAQSSRGTPTRKVEALAIPAGWVALVDGRPAAVRPLDRAAVFQWIDPDDQARRTALIQPTDAVPAPPLNTARPIEDAPKVAPWAAEPENLLLLAGIGAAVASAGLISAGLGTRATLPEPSGGEANPALVDEVRSKARRANALGYIGQGAGVTAVGLIVTSRLAF